MLHIGYPFILTLTVLLLLFFDGSGTVLACIGAVLLHESAHAAVYIMLTGCRPSFRVSFGGLEMRCPVPLLQKWQRVAVLAAGPLANLLTAGLCFAFAARRMRYRLLVCGIAHLFSGLLNLLPVGFLDGGQLLELFLTPFPRLADPFCRMMRLLFPTVLAGWILFGKADHLRKGILLCFFLYYCFKSFRSGN